MAPGYFLSEAADVFAWLMHLQNLIHSKSGLRANERGVALTEWLWQSYPDRCKDCLNPVCTCPPILPGTLGRIAHEIPTDTGLFAQGGALLSSEEAASLFDIGARTIRIGNAEIETTVDLIRDVHHVVTELKLFAVRNQNVADARSVELSKAIEGIEELAVAQRLTQESIDALAVAIAGLPSESRQALMGFLTGLGSSVWATALIQAVRAVLPAG